MQLKRDLLRGLKSCFAITALLIANLAYPTIACEQGWDPEFPTQMAITEKSDAIIVGKVDNWIKQERNFGDVLIKPFALLKGDTLPQFVVLQDVRLAGDVILDHKGKQRGIIEAYHSDPYNIFSAHPEANGGACNRYSFAKGMNLVLFLKKNKKGFDVITPPFTRTLEDVPSLDAPWVKAVKHYITISRLPKNKQSQAAQNISKYYSEQHYTRETSAFEDLFASLSMGCDQRNENKKEKCQYLWGKFDAIGNIDSATFLSRKAKPAPYKPELLRSLSGLLMLLSFFAVLIFLSFGRRKNPMKNN